MAIAKPASKLQSLKRDWQSKVLEPQVQRFGERQSNFTTSSNDLTCRRTLYPR